MINILERIFGALGLNLISETWIKADMGRADSPISACCGGILPLSCEAPGTGHCQGWATELNEPQI